MTLPPDQWNNLGKHLHRARVASGLTQAKLASLAGLRQRDISLIEKGSWQPSLRILTNIARQLAVSLHYFIDGQNQTTELPNRLTLELHDLGIIDLDISQAVVPGAFRTKEDVLALAIIGDVPDTRIVDALPYVLLRRTWDAELLHAYGRSYDPRSIYRIAWLSEIALVIKDDLQVEREAGIERSLRQLIQEIQKPAKTDSLGYPADTNKVLSPIHRRWNINYATTIPEFLNRAKKLQSLSLGENR